MALDGSLYRAFLVAALVLVLLPGPDMAVIIVMGVRGGARAGLAAALGISAGLLIHTIAVMLGLATLFTVMPPLYYALRWVGAAYLTYLAVKTFRERRDAPALGIDETDQDRLVQPQRSCLRAFGKAALVNVTNPKVILFDIAFFPQFVNPRLGHVAVQFFILGISFICIDIAIDGPIGLAAGRIGTALYRSRRVAKTLNTVSASVFAGLAARLILMHE